MALVALVIVALAENARIPFDNPATHLELTMVHEAMVLEYSGRHLAMIELAASLQAAAVHVADRLHLLALGLVAEDAAVLRDRSVAVYLVKLAVGGLLLAISRRRSRRCGCSGCRTSSASR